MYPLHHHISLKLRKVLFYSSCNYVRKMKIIHFTKTNFDIEITWETFKRVFI